MFKLNTGDTVKEIKRQNKRVKVGKWEGYWINIDFNGKKGWVLSAFIKPKINTGPSLKTVIAKNLFGKYWELKNRVFDKKGRDPNDEDGEQGFLDIRKTQISFGSGGGYFYCIVAKTLKEGNKYTFICKKRGAKPDHKNEGEQPGGRIIIELFGAGKVRLISDPF